jgi:hypothetical protein
MAMVVLGASALKAQELTYGGQVAVSLPESDLGNRRFLDHKLGYGAGLQLAIAFPGGRMIVPRVDYTAFRNGDNADAKARTFQVGVDYDYFPCTQRANDGLYVGVGLGYGATEFKLNTPVGPQSDTPNNVYYAAQVGCMFTRHLGAELRYVYAQYRPLFCGSDITVDSPTLNASLVCRY